MAYKNKHNWTLGENKPNSNPILSAVGGLQMNSNDFVRKDYENKTTFRLQQNKPNQSQFQTQSIFFSKLVPAKPVLDSDRGAGILCSRMNLKLSPPASKLDAIYLRTENDNYDSYFITCFKC